MYTTLGPWKLQTVLAETPPSLFNVRLVLVAQAIERRAELSLLKRFDEETFEAQAEALDQATEYYLGVVDELTPRELEIAGGAAPRIIRWGRA